MRSSDAQNSNLWHAVSAETFVWTELDGDFAVYHRLSGTTHFLNAASRQLLEALRRSPMTTEAVAEEFAEVVDPGSGEAALQSIGEFLAQFEAMGFLHRDD